MCRIVWDKDEVWVHEMAGSPATRTLLLVLAVADALHVLPLRGRRAAPRRAAPRRAAPRMQSDSGGLTPFELSVDLGDGGGVVRQELAPLFSSSTLVTLRMGVPFDLEAEPSAGVVRVVQEGYGLLVGDVLRCFSTFEKR